MKINKKETKIGFLFGAGAERSYGMPSGGKFALDIFRENPEFGKAEIKKMRDSIDKSTSYASNWLPDGFDKNRIQVFGTRVFDSIIRDTVGNNRGKIIDKINCFDSVALDALSEINYEKNIDLNEIIEKDLQTSIVNINVNQKIKYSKFFTDGDKLFSNRYFAVLLEYYKKFTFDKLEEKTELGELIKAIFQLQIGAMSENISRNLEDNIFSKEELELDIFDDLGGSLNVNYESAGVRGLELLSKNHGNESLSPIIAFAYDVIERIYSDVLDYKTLIDSNWHYLYNPYNEWAKFCKISVFLYTVQKYIKEKSEELDKTKSGYYDDLNDSSIIKSVIATTNYSSFIGEKLDDNVVYLNGGVDWYYDPYFNSIGNKKSLDSIEKHFIVPLIFTQSGTKPMTSIDMSRKYVDFYDKLKNSDAVCSVGFAYNPDDEHVNGIIRTIIDRDNKRLYVIDIDSVEESDKRNALALKKQENLAKKLKVINRNNIIYIIVNGDRLGDQDKIWTDILLEKVHEYD